MKFKLLLTVMLSILIFTSCAKINKFPLAMQCWTFRHYSFLETLPKVQSLGIKYLQAYPGQRLDKDNPEIKLDHQLSDSLIQFVKAKLGEYDLKIVSYGVVGFENNESSMRQVFDFAQKMGIEIIVTEPEFDDYSLIEKLVKEYDIKVAIHNHPQPSKYALPETVAEHVDGLDPRIGACADTGHWLRTSVVPVNALKLLEGRIIDVHLKDLNEFGVREAHDVPYGQGVADIKNILKELSRQYYQGYLTIEYENEAEADNPEPSILEGIKYLNSVMD